MFPLQNSNVEFFFLFSRRVQILKTEYKYCTSLSQSDCRYFFVLAINKSIPTKLKNKLLNTDICGAS